MGGKWKGFYCQYGKQHPMELQNVVISAAPTGGTISAAGEDEVGKFTFAGTIDNGNVKFIKQYEGAHRIFYHGKIDGNQIHGNWGFYDGDSQDEFKIYLD